MIGSLDDKALDAIEASVNYLIPMDERAVIDVSGRGRSTVKFEARKITVNDARPLRAGLDLEQDGFTLVEHHAEHATISDADSRELKDAYLQELAPFVKELVGGQDIIPLRNGPVIRRSAASDQESISKPAGFTHLDFTAASATYFRWIAMAWGGIREIEPFSRFAIYQAWRATSTPPHDEVLAVCDPRSVDPADLVPADFYPVPHGIGIQFESQVVKYNPGHRWYYFSDMNRDELLVFKGYDSDPSRACFVPHSPFRAPAGAQVNPRSSIECRFIAFFA
ncbi:CmcJ/NvfI family oxidoreductase [Sphingobium sp.]|uniref:CmcJ/NvfI family oxidoreductase n=1 Tax=Sphingobium sp. TaxID=1912891 RepID=UPI0028BDD653|nr:CmcJ/NvfI family oxidoreductase [Sphingobium sp.]